MYVGVQICMCLTVYVQDLPVQGQLNAALRDVVAAPLLVVRQVPLLRPWQHVRTGDRELLDAAVSIVVVALARVQLEK